MVVLESTPGTNRMAVMESTSGTNRVKCK